MVVDSLAPWAEAVLFTADDLARLPDDGWQYELVEGRLVRMPPPGASHGKVCLALGAALLRFVEEHNLGVVLSNDSGFFVSGPGEEDTVLGPDLAFVSRSTIAPEAVDAEQGYLHLAPDVVVEVASPSQSRSELSAKAKQWLRAGVQLVWIVWPAQQQVDVWEAGVSKPRILKGADELDGGNVLPGFQLPIARLWSTVQRSAE